MSGEFAKSSKNNEVGPYRKEKYSLGLIGHAATRAVEFIPIYGKKLKAERHDKERIEREKSLLRQATQQLVNDLSEHGTLKIEDAQDGSHIESYSINYRTKTGERLRCGISSGQHPRSWENWIRANIWGETGLGHVSQPGESWHAATQTRELNWGYGQYRHDQPSGQYYRSHAGWMAVESLGVNMPNQLSLDRRVEFLEDFLDADIEEDPEMVFETSEFHLIKGSQVIEMYARDHKSPIPQLDRLELDDSLFTKSL